MRLLVLASRPSDYAEMSDLARALAGRGHHALLLYFYAPGDPGSAGVLDSIAALNERNLTGRGVDLDDVRKWQGRQASTRIAGPVQPSRAAEVGLYHLVLALRDRVIGRERAVALRRRFPRLRKVFPLVYDAARVVDVARNLPGGVRVAWQAADQRSGVSAFTWTERMRIVVQGPKVMADAADMEHVYRRFGAFFADALVESRADALLMPEDIVGNLWPVAVRAGHDARIPTLIFPYTLANKEEALQSLKGETYFQTKRNQIAAMLYPRWRINERGADLVRLPSAHIFAHERLGIAPPDPWMMNSGFADAVCVDSVASLEYFRAGGIPAAQMRVVGSTSQDRMFALHENRDAELANLRRELSLSGDKPILLVSGSPNQLSATVPYCEFRSIGDVATYVGESLAPLAGHYHLVVRPHPNYPEFGPMLGRFGFASTMRPTASLVPLSEVFVAFASATIRWAIACGIPTVNYDVFHYGYGDFASASGVKSVSKGIQFRDLVATLVPGSAALDAIAAAAREDRARWSLMDGHSLDRIEIEIEQARERRKSIAKEQQQHA